jgi:hypothetical protein
MKYRVFTKKSELDKAFNSLNGLLQGVSSDNVLRKEELEELHNWVKHHSDLIDRNPFKEIAHVISCAIQDNNLDNEVVEDLKWLCAQFIDENIYFDGVTADIQTLHGFCHGILADGYVSDEEIYALQKWMLQNEHLQSYYPYDEIYTLLDEILEDGVIEEKERIALTAYLNDFIDLKSERTANKVDALTKDVSVEGLFHKSPKIQMSDTVFSFTGESEKMTRNEIAELIQEKGGVFSKGVTKKVQVLLVGIKGNPCWAYSCYGRKVEQAVKLRKAGSNIVIINEADFWSKI